MDRVEEAVGLETDSMAEPAADHGVHGDGAGGGEEEEEEEDEEAARRFLGVDEADREAAEARARVEAGSKGEGEDQEGAGGEGAGQWGGGAAGGGLVAKPSTADMDRDM